jgi:hypothetical protein
MSSFDQFSNNFKFSAQQRLNSLEKELNNATENEPDIDDLEAMLKYKVEDTKQDMSNRIDEIKNAVTSRRPNPNDPDYARKQAQYAQLLSESVKGMNLLKGWLQNIFNRLKQIVTSIIQWIANKIMGIARRIKDAFISLFQIFF